MRQIDAVFHVPDDDQRAHGRGQMVVLILAAGHILDKIMRLEHLADVMKICADSHQEAVGADVVGRRFAEAGDGNRVVVCSRSAADKLLQKGMRYVSQFEQADVGDGPERGLDKREAAGNEEAGGQAPTCAAKAADPLRRIAPQRHSPRISQTENSLILDDGRSQRLVPSTL